LLTPISSPGLRSLASNNPVTGKNTVYRLDVLITTPLPVIVAFKSVVPRSYKSYSSGSISSISTTLLTKYGNVTKYELIIE
jgi:hypothetical protein